MPTNVAINDDLLLTAQEIGGLKTKKDTVNQALEEFIRRRKQKKVIEAFGTIDYFPNYIPKKHRSK